MIRALGFQSLAHLCEADVIGNLNCSVNLNSFSVSHLFLECSLSLEMWLRECLNISADFLKISPDLQQPLLTS
jgi:hypothetical protein